MPLKTDTIEEPILNLTPMIDIVFLLIIFFMVGTQFTELERELDVQVPTVAEARPLTAPPDKIVINISRDGTVLIGGEARDLDTLKDELTTARQRYSEQAVLIRGDAGVEYQHVADVLSTCYSARIASVAMATRLESEQP